jgi:hypothetical protein
MPFVIAIFFLKFRKSIQNVFFLPTDYIGCKLSSNSHNLAANHARVRLFELSNTLLQGTYDHLFRGDPLA